MIRCWRYWHQMTWKWHHYDTNMTWPFEWICCCWRNSNVNINNLTFSRRMTWLWHDSDNKTDIHLGSDGRKCVVFWHVQDKCWPSVLTPGGNFDYFLAIKLMEWQLSDTATDIQLFKDLLPIHHHQSCRLPANFTATCSLFKLANWND